MKVNSDNKFNSLYSYEDIESFKDACNVLNLNYKDMENIVCELNKTSHTLATIFKLKIIRNALNGKDSIKLTEGTIYVPCVHFIPKILIPKRLQDKFKVIGEFNNNNTQYLVLGNNCYECENGGISYYTEAHDIGTANIHSAILYCKSKEIAKHFSKCFGMLIVEAAFGDLLHNNSY